MAHRSELLLAILLISLACGKPASETRVQREAFTEISLGLVPVDGSNKTIYGEVVVPVTEPEVPLIPKDVTATTRVEVEQALNADRNIIVKQAAHVKEQQAQVNDAVKEVAAIRKIVILRRLETLDQVAEERNWMKRPPDAGTSEEKDHREWQYLVHNRDALLRGPLKASVESKPEWAQ